MAQSVKFLACILEVPGSNFVRNTNSPDRRNICRVLNVVIFILGDSPASESYVTTFRNNLYHLRIECSETSAQKIQTPGNRPK
jgi:hypothetical protein